ncbi:MAG TPA: AP2 domain-containing protein [Sedimentisphaerales bacterium]
MTTIQIRILNCLDFIFSCPLLAYRLLRYGYSFRKIDLGEGQFTIVEPRDYYSIRHLKWFVHGNGSNLYAARSALTSDLRSRIIFLHRQLMLPPAGLVVDHRNCDSLDNRRANLRVVTQAVNMRNRRKRKNTSSRFIGVWFDKKRNKWTVQIRYNGQKLWLGRFDDETAAARAYDAAAKKYFGEIARLNNV